MSANVSLLQQVRIASACPAAWQNMSGDDRVRFCCQCKLNVYNLSAMTEQEAVRLIQEKEGRLCGRIHRRSDGTILTQDCPVGLRAIRRKLAGLAGRIAAGVLFAGSAFGFYRSGGGKEPTNYSVSQLEPFASIQRWLDPNSRRWSGRPLLGAISIVDPAAPLVQPTFSAPDLQTDN